MRAPRTRIFMTHIRVKPCISMNKPTAFFRTKAKPSDLTDFHGPKVALLTRSHCALYCLLLSVNSFKYIEDAKPTAAY